MAVWRDALDGLDISDHHPLTITAHPKSLEFRPDSRQVRYQTLKPTYRITASASASPTPSPRPREMLPNTWTPSE